MTELDVYGSIRSRSDWGTDGMLVRGIRDRHDCRPGELGAASIPGTGESVGRRSLPITDRVLKDTGLVSTSVPLV